MKIRLDENVSPRVAHALMAFTANRPGFELSWVRQEHGPGTPESTWLAKFAADDGDAIISGDYQILQHWPDLIAYIESGLVSIFPPTQFKGLKGYGRAAFLIRWWPTFVEKIKSSSAGDIWRARMLWTPDINGFEQLKDPRVDAKRQAGQIEPAAKVYQFRPRDRRK